MGKNSQPTYNPPAPVQRISGQELFSQASDFGKSNMPFAYGAREQALQDVNNPGYYESFQPGGFEQALGNQYFNNIWPDQQKAIMNQLSRSGMADSPVAADVLGRALGRTQFDVGSYLSNLGEQRANNSLNMRNIDPMASILNPYASVAGNQSNLNATAQDQYNQATAQQQYEQAMNKFNQQVAMQKMIGQISPIGGAIYGGTTGGSSGLMNSLGGSISTASAFLPFMMAGGGGGVPGLGSYLTSGGNNMFASPVNPTSRNSNGQLYGGWNQISGGN